MKRFLRGLNHYIVFFLIVAFLVTCCILLFANALMDSLGVVLTEEERRLLVEIAKEHNLFLISDEVYRELIYSGQKINSFLEYEDAAENVIVVDSVSKRFSATGSRVGAVISRNRELMGHALKLCQSRLCTATLDQIGAAALYNTLSEDYYAAVRKEYQLRRDTVVESLRKIPGVQFETPEGAFYLMVTLPVDDADKLQYFLLQEFEDQGETVMYAPGEGFYATPGKGRNEIRIAYVTNPDELRRAVELLGKGIAAYNAGKETVCSVISSCGSSAPEPRRSRSSFWRACGGCRG